MSHSDGQTSDGQGRDGQPPDGQRRDGQRLAEERPDPQRSTTPVPASTRDWREAWRAARDNDGTPMALPASPPVQTSSRPTGTERPGATQPISSPATQPMSTPPAAQRPTSRSGRASVWHRPGTAGATPVPAKEPRAPRPQREAADPSRWMPLGHSSTAPVHTSTPGRPALPGSDPSATAPAMAIGAALPGGPSTGPRPVLTGESSTSGGFRAVLAEGLAKAKSMTSQARPDTGATVPTTAASTTTGPTATGPTTAGPTTKGPTTAGPTTTPGADRGGAFGATVPGSRPSGASNGQHSAGSPLGAQQPPLAPFAGPPAGPGGPSPVAAPPGLGSVSGLGQGAPAVAGAAAGIAAAGVATASSGTVTSPSAAIGGAPTVLLPTVAPSGPGQPARRPKTPRKPRTPRRGTASARAARRGPGLRRAHLKLTRIDPWTVMKISFMLAIAFGIMTVVSVFVIWSMLDTAGVFTAISESVNSVTGDSNDGGVDIMAWVALDRVLGFATLLAVVDVVLITALSTLAAFLYNLASTLLGGIEVTLVEDQR